MEDGTELPELKLSEWCDPTHQQALQRYYDTLHSQLDWNVWDSERVLKVGAWVEEILLKVQEQMKPPSPIVSRAAAQMASDVGETAEETTPPSSFLDLVKESAEPFVAKMRSGEMVTKDDFFALPLLSESAPFDLQLQACKESMVQTSQTVVSMETAASEPFDYALVPFPLAVMLYALEATGGFPAKMCWAVIMMLVCWQAEGSGYLGFCVHHY